MKFKKLAFFLTLIINLLMPSLKGAQAAASSAASSPNESWGLIVVINGNLSDKKRSICAKLIKELNKKHGNNWILQTIPNREITEEDFPDFTESQIDRSATIASIKEEEVEEISDFNDEDNRRMIEKLHTLARSNLNVVYNTYLTSYNVANFIDTLQNGGYKVYTVNITSGLDLSIHSPAIEEVPEAPSPIPIRAQIPSAISGPKVLPTKLLVLHITPNYQERAAAADALPSDDQEQEKLLKRRHSTGDTETFALAIANYLIIEASKFKYALVVNQQDKQAIKLIKKGISSVLKRIESI